MTLPRRPGRVLAMAVAGALLYAGMALASGLDRAAIAHPGLVRLVPDSMRAESAHLLAAQALAAGNLAAAQSRARRAIDAAPADRRGLGLYAAALLLGGDRDAAGKAFGVARHAGMRDPLTLAYGISRALDKGDYPAGARAMEALLRTGPHVPQIDVLLRVFAASSRGRAALAQSLQSDPGWAGNVFARFPRALARSLSDKAAFAQPLGCDAVRAGVERLLVLGEHQSARDVWQTHCPAAAPNGLISDFDFRRLAKGDLSDPFGWKRVPSGDVSIAPSADGGVLITNRSAVSRRILYQPVDLPPGQYRVRVAGDANGFGVVLHCTPDQDLGEARHKSRDGILIVSEGCGGQLLSMWARPGLTGANPGGIQIERR